MLYVRFNLILKNELEIPKGLHNNRLKNIK